MSDDLKPIETRYNGYRFRSRLEARWAVFFEALGVRYEYEPQGYAGRGIAYLPDFWLPDIHTWAEAKPVDPTEDEMEKMRALVQSTRGVGVILIGTPNDGSGDVAGSGQHFGHAFDVGGCGGGWSDHAVHWSYCPMCLKWRLGFGDNQHEVFHADGQPVRFCGCERFQIHRWDDYAAERLAEAAERARSARFESPSRINRT